MRLKTAKGIAMCPSCGFAMPGLDMCSLTNTCVECARKALGEACSTCPEKDACDLALEGLRFIKSLEPKLDIYVDVSKEVVKKAERYGAAEIAIAYMKALMGLVKALQSHSPAEAFTAWLKAVFKPSTLHKLNRTPYIVSDFYLEFKAFCQEFNCKGLEAPLSNLLSALISLALMEGSPSPEAYFNLLGA
ncbi:MAG: hypothetical protein TU35_003265 [Thermoproteus sp. AZ2]|uniref:Uncharacterized protein n=1 Tax=Thermoproteus sp. AZ2 TaxID=1609232 RepID=A0ACC6V0E6_9CREN